VDARDKCVADHNTTLASINSAARWQEAVDLLQAHANGTSAWFGWHDGSWLDGSPDTFDNWDPADPPVASEYGLMHSSDSWEGYWATWLNGRFNAHALCNGYGACLLIFSR